MSKLAIRGGDPIRKEDFPAWPIFDEREQKAVNDVLKSGKWWRYSFGEGVDWHEAEEGDRSQVAIFQEEFARFQGSKYGVACVNGTAALDMLVRALDIGPGMEVIIPAYTYVAGATCILQSNAVPIFVDVDANNYNIDPKMVEKAITPNTVGVMPCHFGGQMADMDSLLEITKKHGIHLIEDAAHAHGSRWNGKGAGTIGIGGTFSFQNAKNMTAGEGGIVITDDEKLAERIESLTWSGRRRGRPWYEFYELGWNYRMTEFQGAILRIQLTRLEEQNKKRRENASYLTKRLLEIGGLDPVVIDPRGRIYSVHIFIIRYNPVEFKGLSREKLIVAINAEGVPAFSGYTHPLYKNPMFLGKKFYNNGCPISCSLYGKNLDYRSFEEKCPVSERACSYEAIWLEHRLFLGNKKDMDDIAEAFIKVKQNLEELL
jgi:dTDP-4-amino-4,6-dideoxygalactose transaminase